MRKPSTIHKLQVKLTPNSLLSTAAGIFFIISSTRLDILKNALLIIITSHNSHIRPMLINYSNFSFVGMGGDNWHRVWGTENKFCRTKFANDLLRKKSI